MPAAKPKHAVNIRPTVSVYATYRRISYKPWNAIAEFVDNSTQNFYEYRSEIAKHFKRDTREQKLQVYVEYDSANGSLRVSDNAHGMNFDELTRALVLDKPPPNTTGRCEFGMGLKTAACWFGSTWTIRTARLGSGVELQARVHVPDLVGKLLEEIPVEERTVKPDEHHTHILIEGLYKKIQGRTAARIKEQLGSMYRTDLRTDDVSIFWNGELVTYEEPPILVETKSGKDYPWRKPISFDVLDEGGHPLHVGGWVGIRNPGNQRLAGFALLRRGRVVLGGPGEGYKPEEVFGQGNTFRSQRLVGELDLDQWPVTQAKDAFDWSGGLEDQLIEQLKKQCNDYSEKAEGLRVSARTLSRADMQLAADTTVKVLASPKFSAAVQQELILPTPPATPEQGSRDLAAVNSVSSGPIVYKLSLRGTTWVFQLHWQDAIADAAWMSVAYPNPETIDIFLNTGHPFFAPYFASPGLLELLQKFVIALALVEKMARQINPNGQVDASDFRGMMNRVLRYMGDLEREGAG